MKTNCVVARTKSRTKSTSRWKIKYANIYGKYRWKIQYGKYNMFHIIIYIRGHDLYQPGQNSIFIIVYQHTKDVQSTQSYINPL